MKKLTIKRKRWLDRHSRQTKLHDELIHVYRPGIVVKSTNRWTFDDQNKPYYQTVKAKKKLGYNISRGRRKELIAPVNFSLYSNPDETLQYIDKIQKYVMEGMPIRIAMEPIRTLSIDAVMYFLAVLKKLKLSGVNYNFIGSLPDHLESKQLLRASGFLNYVHTRDRHADLSHESDLVKIISGTKADPQTAKTVCMFVIEKLGLTRIDTFNLYNMIIELMANTRQHAYFNRYHDFINEWYIFVNYLKESSKVRFIFLDTGAGIPATIRKKGWESLLQSVNMSSHTQFIKSALDGNFRSRTGDFFRGNGLPTINSFCHQGYINDLTIISNRGYFAKDQHDDLSLDFNGTLFYWEMSKAIK